MNFPGARKVTSQGPLSVAFGLCYLVIAHRVEEKLFMEKTADLSFLGWHLEPKEALSPQSPKFIRTYGQLIHFFLNLETCSDSHTELRRKQCIPLSVLDIYRKGHQNFPQ